jgi:PHD/YefM family antitoxin component YafN of YafNO toxin-antitoxin module
MKTTTPKDFRADLKNFLEIADKEPICIRRRTGKKYILISEEKYLALKNEFSEHAKEEPKTTKKKTIVKAKRTSKAKAKK